jgi:hypothetical protein
MHLYLPWFMSLRSRRTLIFVSASVIIAAALVLVALFEFPISVTSTSNGPGGSVVLGARLTVSPNTGAGSLNLSVMDNSNYQFTGIAVIRVSPSLPGLLGSFPFKYDGFPVSSTNPIPVSGSAAGSQPFSSGGIVGAEYNISLSITYDGGKVFQDSVQNLYAFASP